MKKRLLSLLLVLTVLGTLLAPVTVAAAPAVSYTVTYAADANMADAVALTADAKVPLGSYFKLTATAVDGVENVSITMQSADGSAIYYSNTVTAAEAAAGVALQPMDTITAGDYVLKVNDNTSDVADTIEFKVTKTAYQVLQTPDADEIVGNAKLDKEVSGIKVLGSISAGDYIVFKNLDFGAAGSALFRMTLAAANGIWIDVYADALEGENAVALLTDRHLTDSTDDGEDNWWYDFVTATVPVEAEITGVHDVYVRFKSANMNAGPIEFVEKVSADGPTRDPYQPINASTADEMNNVTAKVSVTTNTNENSVGSIRDGAYLVFKNMAFGDTGAESFTINAATPAGAAGVELHAGSAEGTLLGSATTPQTTGWSDYQSTTITFDEPLTGKQDICVVFKSLTGQDVGNVATIAFTEKTTPTPGPDSDETSPYENAAYTISSTEGEGTITLNVAISGLKATNGALALAFDSSKVALADSTSVNAAVAAADGIGVVATENEDDKIDPIGDNYVLFTWYPTAGSVNALAAPVTIATIPFTLKGSIDDINNSTFTLYDLQEGEFAAIEHNAWLIDDAPVEYYEGYTNDLTVNFTYTGADLYPVTFTALEGTKITVGGKDYTVGESGSVVINLKGDVSYTATKEGYNDASGTYTVTGTEDAVGITQTIKQYSVTVNADAEVSVTGAGSAVDHGATYSFTYETQVASLKGKETLTIMVGDKALTKDTDYTTMTDGTGAVTVTINEGIINADVTITLSYPAVITFTGDGYTVTIAGQEPFTIDADGVEVIMEKGATYSYTVSREGYVTSEAVEKTAATETIAVELAKQTFGVTANLTEAEAVAEQSMTATYGEAYVFNYTLKDNAVAGKGEITVAMGENELTADQYTVDGTTVTIKEGVITGPVVVNITYPVAVTFKGVDGTVITIGDDTYTVAEGKVVVYAAAGAEISYKASLEGYYDKEDTIEATTAKEVDLAQSKITYNATVTVDEATVGEYAETVNYGDSFTVTYAPVDEAVADEEVITVKMGGEALAAGTGYTVENNTITVAKVTGALAITITYPVAITFTGKDGVEITIGETKLTIADGEAVYIVEKGALVAYTATLTGHVTVQKTITAASQLTEAIEMVPETYIVTFAGDADFGEKVTSATYGEDYTFKYKGAHAALSDTEPATFSVTVDGQDVEIAKSAKDADGYITVTVVKEGVTDDIDITVDYPGVVVFKGAVGTTIQIGDVTKTIADEDSVAFVLAKGATYSYTATLPDHDPKTADVEVKNSVTEIDVELGKTAYAVTNSSDGNEAIVTLPADKATVGEDYTFTYAPNTTNKPALAGATPTITVKVSGTPVAVNTETPGEVTIPAAVVTGAIEIVVDYPAVITFEGVAGTVVTINEKTLNLTEGYAQIALAEGVYTYTATLNGYATITDELTVGATDATEALDQKKLFTVTAVYDETEATVNAAATATEGEAYTFTYATEKEGLDGVTPAIAITIGGVAYTDYTDNDGTVTIPAEAVTGAIEITVDYPAVVTFTGMEEGTTITVKNGEAVVATLTDSNVIALAAGDYTYTATADDYADATGEFTVAYEDMDVTIDQKEIFNVAINENDEATVNGETTAIEGEAYSFTYTNKKEIHNDTTPTITIMMNGKEYTGYTTEDNTVTIAEVTGDITITVDYPAIITFTGVADTVVTINGTELTLTGGSAQIALAAATYTYSAVLEGYKAIENAELVVGTDDATVELDQKQQFTVTAECDETEATVNAATPATEGEAYTFTYATEKEGLDGVTPTITIVVGETTLTAEEYAVENGTVTIPAEAVTGAIAITVDYPAVITFTGVADTVVTINGKTVTLDEEGKGVIALAEGDYTYTATVNGYADITDAELNVGTADDTVKLNQIPLTQKVAISATYLGSSQREMTVVFIPEEGDEVTAKGYGTATADLAAGTYSVTISAPGCLKTTQTLTVEVGKEATVTAELYAGDINGDDKVSNVDLAYVILGFDKTENFGLADMNASGDMSIDDITAVTANLGKKAK